jgi:hypothetical protein
MGAEIRHDHQVGLLNLPTSRATIFVESGAADFVTGEVVVSTEISTSIDHGREIARSGREVRALRSRAPDEQCQAPDASKTPMPLRAT